MFLGRELSRDQLRKPVNAPSLRACTSEKRIISSAPVPEYSVVGPYRFREQDIIGKGFSSRVYKGTHCQKEGQIFAVKVINLTKFKSSNLSMLQNQIEVHRILNHPNIVKFYDAYKTENFYYIVTEYCPHGDLSTLLNQKRKLEDSKGQEIISQIISGYIYLAKKGILHRDLKPANIMRHGNTWKIGDFGFSTICKTDFFFDKLNVGTPLYMPPQSLKTNKYSFKSDVFAIGIILYEIIHGKTPWDCKTEKQLISKMSKEKIKFSSNTKGDLIKFIEKACETNQYERMSRQELTTFLSKSTASTNPEEKTRVDSQGSVKENTDEKKQKQKLLKYCGSSPKLSILSSPKKIEINQSYRSIKDQESTEISQQSSERIKQKIASRPVSNSPMITSVKKISNTEFLLRELQFCRLIYYMIKNIRYFPMAESVNEKSFVELVLFKHLLRCVKHLEDPGQYYSEHLIGFQQYKNQKQYQNLHTQIRNYVQRYEKQYLDTLKNVDIVVIRSVNRKFPELSYTSSFSKKFYEQFYEYLCNILRQCNHNLSIKQHKNPAEFQVIESLFIYSQIVKEKIELTCSSCSFLSSKNMKSHLCGLGNKIVMDYSRSKMNESMYKELREKIKRL